MPHVPVSRDGAHPRWRGAITVVLMVLVAAMVVRDIFARRWGAAPAPSTDVARRIP